MKIRPSLNYTQLRIEFYRSPSNDSIRCQRRVMWSRSRRSHQELRGINWNKHESVNTVRGQRLPLRHSSAHEPRNCVACGHTFNVLLAPLLSRRTVYAQTHPTTLCGIALHYRETHLAAKQMRFVWGYTATMKTLRCVCSRNGDNNRPCIY